MVVEGVVRISVEGGNRYIHTFCEVISISHKCHIHIINDETVQMVV